MGAIGIHERHVEATLRALSQALGAGLSVQDFLNDRRASGLVPEVIRRKLLLTVSAGRTLSAGFRRLDILGPAELSWLEAGEESGSLVVTLDGLAALRHQRTKDRRRLLLGLAYPAFLFAFAGALLPVPLIFTAGVGDYLIRAFPCPLIVALIGVYALWIVPRLRPSTFWRRGLARGALWLPLVGHILRRGCRGSFAEVMARTLGAGLSVERALSAAISASGDPSLRAAEPGLREALDRGASMAELLEQAGGFHPTFVAAIAQAELIGRLEPAFLELAEKERAVARRAVIGLTVAAVVLSAILAVGIIVAGIFQGANQYFDSIDRMMDDQLR